MLMGIRRALSRVWCARLILWFLSGDLMAFDRLDVFHGGLGSLLGRGGLIPGRLMLDVGLLRGPLRLASYSVTLLGGCAC